MIEKNKILYLKNKYPNCLRKRQIYVFIYDGAQQKMNR